MDNLVSVQDLKPGMVIVQITQQNGPVKIRKSGLVTSSEMVQGLAEMGVLEVEVDPAQAVEIGAPEAPISPTKQLLMNQSKSAQGVDTAISEQFNRSLFLPSVQGIPSVWQHYSKRGALASVIFVGGMAIGWTAANFEQWKESFSQPAPVVVQNNPQAQPSQNQSVVQPPIQPTVASQTTTTEQQVATNQANQQNTAGLAGNGNQVAQSTPVVEEPIIEALEPAPADSATIPPQGRLVSPTPLDEPDVSPELLAKFNEVVDNLRDESRTSLTEEYPAEEIEDAAPDVIRVDQLPPRLMTLLPTMSFAAHMFASDPTDRWVRVNGQELREGDWIDREVQIVEITQNHVIMNFKGQDFRMAALTDW
jgi:general secretion pathway protein B